MRGDFRPYRQGSRTPAGASSASSRNRGHWAEEATTPTPIQGSKWGCGQQSASRWTAAAVQTPVQQSSGVISERSESSRGRCGYLYESQARPLTSLCPLPLVV